MTERALGGYYKNSRKTLLRDLVAKRTRAIARADRWHRSYGDVGCYTDLVAIVHMLDDLIEVIDDPLPKTEGED